MDDKTTEVKFFTLINIIILAFIWSLFVVIIYLRRDALYDDASSIVTLFAAFLAFTGILYSNYRSDKRNELSLINSNKQLIEQLTREIKRKKQYSCLLKKFYLLSMLI